MQDFHVSVIVSAGDDSITLDFIIEAESLEDAANRIAEDLGV